MGLNPYPPLFKYEILHVNIRGAVSNRSTLIQYLSDNNWPELITLNETKLGSLTPFDLPGYKCGARKEVAQTGGARGSMILFREDIPDVAEIEELKTMFKNDEIIGIRIKGNNEIPAISVLTYYNPPSNHVNERIVAYVNDQHGYCVISGDLNCKNLTWGSNRTDAFGEELLNAINQSHLFISNDGSKTRCDPWSGREEVLDLIIHNFDACSLFQKFWVGDCIGSDHYPIHASYHFKPESAFIPSRVRRVENTNWETFEASLNQFASSSSSSKQWNCKDEIDEAVESLSTEITSAFHNACPLQDKNKKKKHQYTGEIRDKVKEKRRLRREKNTAAANENWTLVREKMTQINRLGNEIKKIQKRQKWVKLTQHCESLSSEKDPKKFFRTFKLLSDPIVNDSAQPLTTSTITSEFGSTAATAQEKVDLFAERLQKVHEEPTYHGFSQSTKLSVENFIDENEEMFKVDPSKQYSEVESGDESDLLKKVTVQEVKETLQKCKASSAQGLDQINYQLLKKLPDTFLLLIATLFSCCLHIGYFPEKWKCAKTILIPKPGKDPKQAKNHRPISLLSCLGKILERILAKRLSTYMEQNKQFAATQSGFRSGRMASEHTLHIVEDSYMAFKKKETVASIFLDAEMAFDKCWQNGIRYKFKKNLNLPNRYIRILSSFLTNRSLKVFQDGCWSSAVDIRAGTPQGSPLSPLLYLIMVNDIPSSILSLGKLYQYADDIAMSCRAFSFAAARDKLQKMLNLLEGWCRQWRIKLNGDKSYFLQIHRLRQQDDEDMSLQLFDDIIKPATNAKFLGVELDSKLRFVKHIDEICSKAAKRLAVLRFLARAGTKPEVILRLYKIYIRSLFESGSSSFVSAPKRELEKMQRVQNQAIRIALRLPAYLSIRLLHESSGLPMLLDRLKTLNNSLVTKMCARSETIKRLKEENLSDRQTYNGQYKSPLDIIV